MAPVPLTPVFAASRGLYYDKTEMLALLKNRIERISATCSALDELIQNALGAAPAISGNFCEHLRVLMTDDLPAQIENIEKLPDIVPGPNSPFAPIQPTPEQLIAAQDEVNAARERLERLADISNETELPKEITAIWDLTVKPQLEADLKRAEQHRDFQQMQMEAKGKQEASE